MSKRKWPCLYAYQQFKEAKKDPNLFPKVMDHIIRNDLCSLEKFETIHRWVPQAKEALTKQRLLKEFTLRLGPSLHGNGSGLDECIDSILQS